MALPAQCVYWNLRANRHHPALGMKVEDVFTQNRRLWVRLHEKGGKDHAMPCHHYLEQILAAYMEGAGLADDPKAIPARRKKTERPHVKMAPAAEFIDAILEADRKAPRKQRHTAKRIWERIREEVPLCTAGERTVRQYVEQHLNERHAKFYGGHE